jgi:hypothetical protein
MNISRRDWFATTGGALLAASALPALADKDRGKGKNADVLYGHGMVWNRELEGEAAV